MSRTLAGRRAVLTGASSGIGRALAVELARYGVNLVVAARSAEPLEELARNLTTPEQKAIAVSADITVGEDRERLIRTAVEKLGGIDLLVNNAGIASWGHFANSDEAVMREIMEVNFFAPVDLTRLALPHLTRGNQALIVNVSSMCGRRGLPAWPEYSASKFALSGITEAFRAEFARFDVDTLLVVPGLTKTDLREHMPRNEGKARIDFEKGMSADYVAAKTVRAMIRGKREIVIGSDAKWFLRMHRWFPRLLNRLICRRVRKLYEQQPEEQTVQI